MSLAVEKNPGRLARYAHYTASEQLVKVVLPPLMEQRELLRKVAFKVRDHWSFTKDYRFLLEARNAIVHGGTISSCNVPDGLRAKGFEDETELYTKAIRLFGDVDREFYVQFLKDALTDDSHLEAVIEREKLLALVHEQGASYVLFLTAHYRELFARSFGRRTRHPRQAKPATPPITAEVIEPGKKTTLCWADVSEGMRVRTRIPTECIASLELHTGDEFLWHPDTRTATAKPSEESQSAEREQLLQRFAQLRQRYHQDLMHRKTALDENE